MPTSTEPNTESATALPSARAKLPVDLEEELMRAVHEIERGEYVDLSSEELDRWADEGVTPWSAGSQG
jgi:hypothetical protein